MIIIGFGAFALTLGGAVLVGMGLRHWLGKKFKGKRKPTP